MKISIKYQILLYLIITFILLGTILPIFISSKYDELVILGGFIFVCYGIGSFEFLKSRISIVLKNLKEKKNEKTNEEVSK